MCVDTRLLQGKKEIASYMGMVRIGFKETKTLNKKQHLYYLARR